MIVFTDTMIRKLKPSEKKMVMGEGNGFSIRVMPSGHKTWLYVFTVDGKRREKNLGEYPAVTLETARGKFQEAQVKVKNGVDPLAEEEAVKQERILAPTVAQLIEQYLREFAEEKKKTWKEDERILNKDVLPVLGKMKARDVKRAHVISLIDGMKHRGPNITLNTFKIIRRMFRFALKRGTVEVTPCTSFDAGEELPTVKSRERTLSEAEIKTLWSGLDNAGIGKDVVRALKLTLVTCQRPGEIIAMHRRDIAGRWWEFEPKLTKITKETPRLQRIYLSDMALELVGDGNGYIFPSPVTDTHITERALAYSIRRNLKDYTRRKPSSDPKVSNIPTMEPVNESKKLVMNHFVPHDLRRTGATFLSNLGFMDEIVDAVLAHLKKGTIRLYNKNKYDAEKQTAMEAWAVKLKEIVTGEASPTVTPDVAEPVNNVVNISTAIRRKGKVRVAA